MTSEAMPEPWTEAIADAIRTATGENFAAQSATPCGGGCINEAWLLHGSTRDVFVKLNRASAKSMFAAEALGLNALAKAAALRVPRPIAQGEANGQAFLALEALRFGPAPDQGEGMGEALAALHRVEGPSFGWPGDNFIGSAPQHNDWLDDWPAFFRERRLRPQFTQAARLGSPVRGADTLLEAVDELLAGHTPRPSLLHGDLWSGNAAHDERGWPAVFDPACYYGDRETDLAFTRMFGGFGPGFYAAYEAAWPLPPAHERRAHLYNLYHLVNHANLFGGGYQSQAENVIRDLLC